MCYIFEKHGIQGYQIYIKCKIHKYTNTLIHKYKVLKRPNMCYIFEKLVVQGYQLWSSYNHIIISIWRSVPSSYGRHFYIHRDVESIFKFCPNRGLRSQTLPWDPAFKSRFVTTVQGRSAIKYWLWEFWSSNKYLQHPQLNIDCEHGL